MKIASAKNTMRGIFFGVINKMTIILMPFIIRTILTYKLGAEYAGLNSLFTSILRVLNMAELGFASAVAFSLYKPAADDDTVKICALLKFYKKLYYTVGAIVLVIGLSFMPFLDDLIKGDYPADVSLRILYFIYLLDTAASYFLFSYKNLILNVYQRIDVISIISTILHLVVYVSQIIILVVFKAYYLFIIFELVYTVANNLFVARYVKNRYPDYVCRGKLDQAEGRSILKNAYGMLLFKICSTTRNSLDTIFISAFIGLTAAAIYGNYYYVFAGVLSIQTIILESMKGGIGNKIVTETPEKNHEDMRVYMMMFAWLSGACTACMLCLYQPFMTVWMGAERLLDEPAMILLCVYFYVLSMGSIRFLYHQSAGLFWQRRYWTIVQAAINLVGNYVLVQLLGILGVVIATIISLVLIDFGYSTKIVYEFYFKNKKIWVYFRDHGIYFLITALGCTTAYLICSMLPFTGILAIVVRLPICLVVSNAIFFLGYSRLPVFQNVKCIQRNVLNIIRKRKQ